MKRTARTSFIAITASAALGLTWLALATAAPSDPSKPAAAPGLTPDGQIDFNRDIRPILAGSCFACHGPDAGDRKADLRLDTFDGATRKHDTFTGVVPGDVAASRIIAMVTHPDPKKRMPKRGEALTDKQVAVLKAWIAGGAKYAKHWSYVKPLRPVVPKVSNAGWVRTPIDAFILARLDAKGLRPSPEADRAGLLRRLSLDLTGLPPTLAEVDAFVNDPSADAYENAVDRLLASPRYGEHWARKWLDLARYADSAGYADDPARTIWGYRDWVIRAINENKPFDTFTIEQMAGDLLPNATLDQRVATAFHRNTQTNNEGGTSDEEFRVAAVVDRVNTTMEVWMGTTMSCAQCHDHKYDPISQKEYFEFYAILNQTEDADRRNEAPIVSVETAEQNAKKAQLRKQIAELEKRATQRTPDVTASQVKWEQKFNAPVAWTDLRPVAAKASSGKPITIANDGTLYAGEAAATDTHTLTIAPPASKLAGVRIQTLPHDALPGKGAGHGGGNFVITRVLGTLTPPAATPVNGRYVRVSLAGKGKMIHLAEVQVFSGNKNLARAGKASQSSTDFNGPAKLAIDGNTNGDFQAKSVTHTKISNDPWWEVDLGESRAIDRVVVWNRSDNNLQGRLDGAVVSVLDANRKTVWQTTIDKASTKGDYATGGARSVSFTAAFADYDQANFNASNVLDTPKPDATGWAVGGAHQASHTLTLIPDGPVDVPAGSKLTLSIEQKSPHANHTLGQYRVAVTNDPQGRLAAYDGVPGNILAILNVPAAKRSANQKAALANHYMALAPQLKPIRDELAKLKKQLASIKPVTTVPVFAELPKNKQRTTHIQLRGSFLNKGDKVTAGLPEVFSTENTPQNPDRLDMARWLISADNPLTARVAVNRYWEQIFGIGLVETNEEFGAQGTLPSHPKLLDWLAVEFVEGGWDVKQLLKMMVMSNAYRQSSRVTPQLIEADPMNRLLARGPRFRLPAESIRDQALFASDLLSDKMYGPPAQPPQPNLGLKSAFGGGIDWKTSQGDDRYRRGVYTRWRRTSPYPSMTTFDAPNRQVCEIRRSRTNTPLQALVTLNDPVFVEAAQALGRLMAAHPGDNAAKVTHGFRRTLARPPSQVEVDRLVKLYEAAHDEYAGDKTAAMKMATDPLGPAPKGADPVDLAAWAVVGNVLLNLDETLMNR